MSRRVLVADDSATIQKVIKIAFSRHELEIVEATSLIESLTSVTRTRVDALILDASLPGARGPEDFTKLRSEAGNVPALLLVGTYDSIDEEAFRRAGFTHFLKKPFESTDIVSTLDGLLGGGMTDIPELTPPPPLGRPQHPTMFVSNSVFNPLSPPELSHPNVRTFPEDDATGAPPPPPPALDQARKGRRAFGGGEETGKLRAGGAGDEATDPRRAAQPSPVVSPGPPVPPLLATTGPSGLDTRPRRDGVAATPLTSEKMAPLEEDLPALVRQAVEDYCERHFKSLAREVIATELRRLADEKARHLVDN